MSSVFAFDTSAVDKAMTISLYKIRESLGWGRIPMNIDRPSSSSVEHTLLIAPLIQKISSSINSSCSIHTVPNCFRQGNENAYIPQIISIGPFHRDNESLQDMEDIKKNYLRDLISRTPNNVRDSNKILEEYLIAIRSVEETARGCYSETIHLGSRAFIEMMLVDGCFIIALLCKAAHLIDVSNGDPIFKTPGKMRKLQNDLLMLENQIPFIVLQSLFNVMDIQGGDDFPSLVHLALNFFKVLPPTIRTTTKEDPKIYGEHLLHLFHSNLLPTAKQNKQSDRNTCFQLIINLFKRGRRRGRGDEREANHYIQINNFDHIDSVTAHKNAGIKFKKAKEADSFLDVKFKNGTMEIPKFSIHGTAYSVFLNLIAFERCYSDCTKQVTDYAVFMKCLTNSAEDIGTLRQSGIIKNSMGTDDEVAAMFRRLGREVAISGDGFYLFDVFRDVNLYRPTRWKSCKERLKRFCLHPVTVFLGIIQVIISLYVYFRPPASPAA